MSGFTCFIAFSQEIQNDSIFKQQEIENVVITGQFEPQSIKKSVHNVRVISKEDIQNLGAVNLGDVLNQYLNITVTPNAQTGRSSVSLFGLDSQYFKVLVDNIPLVTDTGIGESTDLSQINLDNVERIEIIEGAMGVTHGANAVSGILNIITKKKSKYKWEINASIQEETVGEEFSLFDKGRHIQQLNLSHSISENWYVSVGANRNDFKGLFGDKEGKSTATVGKRGTIWLPKEQYTGNGVLGYHKGNTRIFYKFDYFDEAVSYYNPVVVPVNNYPFPTTYYSNDKRFLTNRYFHHLNYYGPLFNDLIFNISASYQKQDRQEEKYNYYILEEEERNNEKATAFSNEVLYSTGTITNFFKNKKFDLQLGYELSNEKSFAGASTGLFRDDLQQAIDVRKRIENYDAFVASEINFTDKFSIRPGFRYSFQSLFDNQYSYSMGLRYLFEKGVEARLSSGVGYRTPNFDELFTYFVDSNHNVQGNPDLAPEQSVYTEANLKKYTYFNSGLNLYNSITSGYMVVDDKIDMILTSIDPIQQFQYMNIDEYKMWNVSTNNQLGYKNWNVSAGFSLIGISQIIDTGALNIVSEGDFLYTFNLNTSVNYNVEKWNTQFSLYFKHNGKTRQYQVLTENGNAQFVLSEVEAYNWLDASIRKTFYNGRFELMAGARNLLDITNIVASTAPGAGGVAHGGSTSNIMLGYGRSYFLKLTYNLNF